MASEKGCPADEEIASYVEGGLSDGGLARIETHLDGCERCARAVVELARPQRSAPDGPSTWRPRIFAVGQLIAGRYRVLAFLGAGGMGEVYEALDEDLQERIALKTVSAAASLDERAVGRLKAEVQLARRITHRNVCRIYDFGAHSESSAGRGGALVTPFLTMELLEGQTLAWHIINRGPIPQEESIRILRQLVSGLRAAHDAGVIHRDFKSENVLVLPSVDEDPRVVITDFGLSASVAAPGPVPMGSSVGVYGTRQYLAPERVAGAPGSMAADIYSLGIVLWELVTGALAGAGTNPLSGGDVPPPGPLRRVIARCLEGDPARRPRNPAEVLRILEGADTPATPPPRPRHGARILLVAGAAALLSVGSVVAIEHGPLARRPSDARARAQPRQLAAAAAAPSMRSVAPQARPTRAAIRGRAHRRLPSGPPEPAAPEIVVATPAKMEPPAIDEPIRELRRSAVEASNDDAPIDPFH